MSIIEVRDLCKSYPDGREVHTVLDHVNLSFEEGEFAAVIGKSGSGKSTLLNLIGGLDCADSGEILMGGENISRKNDREMSKYRGEKVGFVFQSFHLIPVLDVWENIVLPLKLSKRPVDNGHVSELLKLLEIEEKKNAMPPTLSGGQQQRVAIARALAGKPQIVLADEPTGNLDAETGKNVMELFLKGIREFHQTLIMVTHDNDMAQMADRIIRI